MDTSPWIPCFAVTSAVTASSGTALFRGNRVGNRILGNRGFRANLAANLAPANRDPVSESVDFRGTQLGNQPLVTASSAPASLRTGLRTGSVRTKEKPHHRGGAD